MRRVEDEISRGVVHVDPYPHAIQFSPEHLCATVVGTLRLVGADMHLEPRRPEFATA